MDIPWNENATLVRLPGKSAIGADEELQLLFEGPLSVMVSRVAAMKPSERGRLRISLPDRAARPRTFEDAAITMLIDKLARARVTSADTITLPPA